MTAGRRNRLEWSNDGTACDSGMLLLITNCMGQRGRSFHEEHLGTVDWLRETRLRDRHPWSMCEPTERTCDPVHEL